MATGGYSPQILDEIKARVDLVELIGQFASLKRAGENWKALCPFHAEKTPSFMVNPKKGIFHCFGCGAGGDAFGFLMRQDRLSFPEAVRALAQRTGVELPAASGTRSGETDGKMEALYRTMALAARFYEEALWNSGPGERARRYIESRGVDRELARRFGLGYAPEGWDNLLSFMKGESVAEETVVQAGLALPRPNGPGCYDRFRGRLLFQIRDAQGRPIAFGGRALGPEEEPKYLNSPETPLYVKGRTLYALDLAKPAMREKNRGLLVEGYMDCLMAHQHGFTETVAVLGTALTPAQLGLLRRYADEVIAFFDADQAGQKASGRIEEMMDSFMEVQDLGWAVARTGSFEKAGHAPVRVALLPAGHDPDSFLRAEGAAAFDDRIERARSILSYALDKTLAEEETATARGRAAAHARIALLLSKVTNAEEATALAREAAQKLGVDSTQLWIEAQRLQGSLRRNAAPRPEAPAGSEAAVPLFERDLLHAMVANTGFREEMLAALEAEDLSHAVTREIFETLKRHRECSPEQAITLAESETCRGWLSRFAMTAPPWDSSFEAAKRWAERRRRSRTLRELARSIAAKPAEPDQEELMRLAREAEAAHRLSLGKAGEASHF